MVLKRKVGYLEKGNSGKKYESEIYGSRQLTPSQPTEKQESLVSKFETGHNLPNSFGLPMPLLYPDIFSVWWVVISCLCLNQEKWEWGNLNL